MKLQSWSKAALRVCFRRVGGPNLSMSHSTSGPELWQSTWVLNIMIWLFEKYASTRDNLLLLGIWKLQDSLIPGPCADSNPPNSICTDHIPNGGVMDCDQESSLFERHRRTLTISGFFAPPRSVSSVKISFESITPFMRCERVFAPLIPDVAYRIQGADLSARPKVMNLRQRTRCLSSWNS